MNAAEAILFAIKIWLYAGAMVAAVFLTFGMDRIDEDAQGAYFFRPLLVPGILLIWPLVLWRWWILETGRDKWALRHAPPRRAHGFVWMALGIIIPLTLIVGLSLRQTWPEGYEPERISAPSAKISKPGAPPEKIAKPGAPQ